MRVLAVIHGPDVRPEIFADVIAEDGHELLEWDIRSRACPPDGFDAVLVFGGDQNVGEEDKYPWLRDEYAALRRWVEQETPLLGVCLGAQTLAHSLGAPVRRVPPELAGFYDTELTSEGERDPVLGVLPERFRAFNGNAYSFEVPAGGQLLAAGPLPQAFRAGARSLGRAVPSRRSAATKRSPGGRNETLPRPRAELEQELDTELAAWQELGRRLCRGFLATAA